jgi:hypothetical protein
MPLMNINKIIIFLQPRNFLRKAHKIHAFMILVLFPDAFVVTKYDFRHKIQNFF